MKTILEWKQFKYIGDHPGRARWYCTLCHKAVWTFYSGWWATSYGTPICDCENEVAATQIEAVTK